ncbi:unnamed protein product [Enterobius vermicularis]|uniref:Uncharacterized protein n=1 Tax=Enterobius vermicularis TaxID=51028 RepID=A0A0N4VHC6_ENTVE|nr:unnamed protein product [Enterobius vermicularis]
MGGMGGMGGMMHGGISGMPGGMGPHMRFPRSAYATYLKNKMRKSSSKNNGSVKTEGKSRSFAEQKTSKTD